MRTHEVDYASAIRTGIPPDGATANQKFVLCQLRTWLDGGGKKKVNCSRDEDFAAGAKMLWAAQSGRPNMGISGMNKGAAEGRAVTVSTIWASFTLEFHPTNLI